MVSDTLKALGISAEDVSRGDIVVKSPIDGAEIGRVRSDSAAEVDAKIAASVVAFEAWRNVPAPRRGELVRLFGEELRANKEALGRLVAVEAGKIFQEGLGEVQEMIDICDFAVGLSRQLYGLTIASERPGHRMMETWHPVGPVGIISAFNFPVAVWAWNAALAVVCGDSVIWKPSEKTPLTALATQKLFERAVAKFGDAPKGLSQVIQGLRNVGEQLAADKRVPLISATGSTRMGKALSPVVAARLGRTILELGGNNAMIVAPSADLKLAERAITFSAVGTAGQRCTSLRRVIAHESVRAQLVARLKTIYGAIKIGNPLEAGTLVGPLIDAQAFDGMQNALVAAKAQGGKVFGGERALGNQYPNGFYVHPALVEMPGQSEIVKHETFAPILYVLGYKDFDEAVALQNGVTQGLSSCIFTRDMQEAERFVAASGSDCGIANVNIGPSGAEIGGAFGGEKDTGGGRESGSDSWKAYMRRQTVTINYSNALPLAQGIKFDTD
ncbi:MAG: aldehyde dehydrogenase family protein [Alphaproteobacteria bacterium]|nr:aldehyde dehydrogenase family protein [Alphaproteobacteria bacterium]